MLTRLGGVFADRAFLGAFFLIIASALILFATFRSSTSSFKILLILAVLPLGLLLSVDLFFTLLPGSVFWWLVFGLLIFAGTYISILAVNVFLVSLEFKTVPLYRAASMVSFILVLFQLYLLYNFVLSFRLFPWVNAVLITLISFPFFFYFLWSASISEKEFEYRRLLVFVSVCSWFIGQISLAVSFWPAGVSLASLYLVSFVYVLGGIVQADIKGRLFRRTFWEYIWVGIGALTSVFLLTIV